MHRIVEPGFTQGLSLLESTGASSEQAGRLGRWPDLGGGSLGEEAKAASSVLTTCVFMDKSESQLSVCKTSDCPTQ